jgi:hypothetical protein
MCFALVRGETPMVDWVLAITVKRKRRRRYRQRLSEKEEGG